MTLTPLTRAIIWSCLSGLCFAASATATHALGQKLPAAELSFFRNGVAALVLLPFYLSNVRALTIRDPWWHVVRCVLGVVALYGFVYAIANLPIGLAALLFFARVFIMPVAGRILLGERSSPAVWWAVAIGFIGVGIAIGPKIGDPTVNLGLGAVLVAALTSTGSQAAVRRLTRSNAPEIIVLLYSVASLIGTLPVAVPVWVMPPVTDIPVVLAVGLFGFAAQYTTARGYVAGPLGFLAPLDFLNVPASALLGYLAFADTPSLYEVIGSVPILLAVLILTLESRKDAPVGANAPKGEVPAR